ncbi:PDZ domain-containing protein [Pedobacter sp. UC225_65]|uniref:PDZ domain-containing protein n=1 Tax=Pedobacter sp. UC225_65 TaxID=3350173 RepID=UPI0036711898
MKEGDIIKKVEGVEIYDSPDLQEKIGRMRPGDKVALTVLKSDGTTKNVTVTLKPESNAALASNSTANAGKSTGVNASALGAEFAPASAAIKSKYGITNGVVVTKVEPGKLFDYYDIAKGVVITKINGKAVNSVEEVEKALPTSRDGKTTITGISDRGIYTISFQ